MPGFRVKSSWPILAALLALTPAHARAAEPVTVHPGDPAVDGSFIRPYTNQWKITQVTPSGKSVGRGTWTDKLEMATVNGKRVIKRTQTELLTERTVTNVNIVDPKTLAPISSEITDNKGYLRHWDFDGNKVQIKRSSEPAGGEVKSTTVTLDTPVYDFLGGMYGMLLVAFPLKAGYSAKFPIFNDDKNSLDWLTFTVGGQEPVDAGSGKKVQAWAVQTEAEGFKMTFYLTKESPYVIRLVELGPRGSLSFDMF
jgi:hypothetical protein